MFFVILCLLAVMSATADKGAAVRIVNDEAKVTMGKNQDVSLTRTGPGKLKIQSDVTTTGTLSAASLAFGRVTRFALDIDGKPYHPKCDLVRPAILKLGKFGGSNNHMGVYVDVKVYGSHRGGYHCGGADASHEVIQWHNCDRQSYRHYVIYGGDKSNSFTVSSSGNPKLVNLYDGKTRGDYINVATADGVSLVFEQICGAYLDYTVVLEFHHRSATASGFELDAGIATKQSIAWDSIATPKKIEIPIRGSQKTNANSLVFGQVKRFALDIDGKSYHPKCDQARPALLKLGKFGGSNNHMGSYMDIKVYGSHRGGYHCGGADASHKVISTPLENKTSCAYTYTHVLHIPETHRLQLGTTVIARVTATTSSMAATKATRSPSSRAAMQNLRICGTAKSAGTTSTWQLPTGCRWCLSKSAEPTSTTRSCWNSTIAAQLRPVSSLMPQLPPNKLSPGTLSRAQRKPASSRFDPAVA